MISIKDFQFNMLPVNTYVVWDETKEAVVIDPGCYYPEEGEQLCTFIRSNGLNVKHLLNTHLHFDHIYGNPIVENEFGVLAEANGADMPWLTGIRQRLAAFGIHCNVTINPIQPENILKEGDTIAFGNTVLQHLLPLTCRADAQACRTVAQSRRSYTQTVNVLRHSGRAWAQLIQVAELTVLSTDLAVLSAYKKRSLLLKSHSLDNLVNVILRKRNLLCAHSGCQQHQRCRHSESDSINSHIQSVNYCIHILCTPALFSHRQLQK